jgi:hypothetical protein
MQWVQEDFLPSSKVKLTAHFHLVPKLKIYGAKPPFCVMSLGHGAYLSTGTNLPLL